MLVLSLSAIDALQVKAFRRTLANQRYAWDQLWADYKGDTSCEVCGADHGNYHCCERCNYDRHICFFCGDSLGHSEISACYIDATVESNASGETSSCAICGKKLESLRGPNGHFCGDCVEKHDLHQLSRDYP